VYKGLNTVVLFECGKLQRVFYALVFLCRQSFDVFVLDKGTGHCQGPEGNGVCLGKGGEGGPSPPGSKEDKQLELSEGGGNMEKEEEGRTR
jgi:hypothetical protein